MSIQSTFNQSLGNVASIVDVFSRLRAKSAVNTDVQNTNVQATVSTPNAAEQVSIQKTAELQQTKTKQRRLFRDYMQNEQTSWGKFKDLDPKLQKTILDTYNKADRKKFMDERDKVNG